MASKPSAAFPHTVSFCLAPWPDTIESGAVPRKNVVTKLKLLRLDLLLLFLAVPGISLAQDSSAAAPASAATQSKTPTPPAQTEAKKAKKVWTNEELSTVKGNVSVVGEPDSSPDDRNRKTPSESNGQNRLRQQQIARYREQIQQLQAQIEAADKRISQLKNFKGENTAPSGGINPSQGYNMVPLEDQVKQLEERKKQLQNKIQDIESEARKSGIEPGEIR
jgi:hypothetical protein